MPVKDKAAPAKKGNQQDTKFLCDINPDAKEVFLVGDFNNWSPRADRMVKRQGAFRKSKRLAPGEYQYKFLIDGEWHADPSAAIQVLNEFGTNNSVIEVCGTPKK